MNKKITPLKEGALVIYANNKGKVELRADIDKETMWATQAQIVQLFEIDQSVVARHILNIVKDREVDRKSNMQKMHNANSDRPIMLYSLDIILAVGYRTNSKKAILFRKWATAVLREYLVKGLVVNEKRLEELHIDSIRDIEDKVAFIQDTIRNRQLNQPEIDGILSVVNGYAHSWLFLKKYDEGELALPRKEKGEKNRERQRFGYDFVRRAINELKDSLLAKEEASEIFGNERDGSFQGILGNIYQTFGGNELYATLEEKAGHLLYFVIKDHPFTDGNKRIGSFLFVYFLDRNRLLYRPSGEKRINDNALVALALLIAESNPKLKDTMVKVVVNMLLT